MKWNIFNKLISLLLVLTMLVPLTSPVFAAESTVQGKNGYAPYMSDMGLLGIGGDGDSQLFGGGFGGWGLKTLLGGAISGLVGIGLNQAYTAIFGKDSDRIMAAISELSKKIDVIDAKIDLMISETQKGNINAFLNDYRSKIAPYKALLKDFETARQTFGDNKEKSTNFALSVYYGTNPSVKRYGDNIVAVVRELKAMLVDDIRIINGQKCNVFGAFDLLEKYNNLWEHQGYDIRCEFRNTALGLFTDFAIIAEKAVADAITDCKNRNDSIGLDAAELADECLKDYITAVDAMEARCKVIQHTDIRIFRDIEAGKDKYAFYRRVDPAYVKTPPLNYAWYTFYDLAYSDYLHCMTTTNYIKSRTERNGGLEVISGQVWRGVLQDIYNSYKGKKTSLYDIFFDAKEGNFINVGQLNKGTRFATDYYIFTKYESGGFWYDQLWHMRLDTNVVDDKGKLNETVRLLRLSHGISATESWVDHLLDEKFFSVIPYSGAINQGGLYSPGAPQESKTADMISGMADSYTLPYAAPVTLSVQEAEGARYQWFVHKGNNDADFEEIEGETGSTYTLPELEASMNGWRYQCAIAVGEVSEWGEGYTLADPVTLNLTGEGIPEPVTVHEVSNAQELEDALAKVTDGSWDNHTLKLTAEIKYQKPITLYGNSVTIDLNGYDLGVMPLNTAEPNINPMSTNAEIAAVNVHFGSLNLTGEGELNVFAPEGVAYGVYAGELGEVTVHNAISNNGGTAVYVTDGGVAQIKANAGADGNGAHAIKCFDGGSVTVSGNATATGELTCGVYADETNDLDTTVTVNGDITVSGDNSRGISVSGEKTFLEIGGSVAVSGNGASGISASGGNYDDTYMVWIAGDVTAPDAAVNASAGAGVRVSGNAISMDEGTTAIYAVGGSVTVEGNVTATGINGTAISASKWDLIEPTAGAFVMVDGKITAYTPLRIESLPVGENEHTGETAVFGHYIYTDGTNTVWANEESFVSTNPNAQSPGIISHPQDETVEPGDAVTLTVQANVIDGGILSYQWYSNTTNDFSSGTPIDGATNTSYSPPTDRLGIRYYYVIVTNTNEAAQGEKSVRVISSLAAVNVTYTVTFDKNGGDTDASPVVKEVTASGYIDALPTAPKRTGYNFKGWNTQADGSGTVFTATTEVTGSMTVYAQWIKRNLGGSSDTYYTVAFETDGGSEVPNQRLSRYSKVTKPSDPTKEGFNFDGWFTDSKLTKAYDFSTAVTSEFTLYAAWKKSDTKASEKDNNEPPKPDTSAEWENPFADVGKSDWFYTAVEYVCTNKLFNGTADAVFSPNMPMTRGMLVTVLHRLAGYPAAGQSTGYNDVSGDAYYYQAVSWGTESGIINGVGDNAFAPDGEVTREQVAAILWRYAKFSGIDVSVGENTNILSYNDFFNISEYAIGAMQWACGAGLITGKPGGALEPQSGATRAEVAAMLQRFSEIMEKA